MTLLRSLSMKTAAFGCLFAGVLGADAPTNNTEERIAHDPSTAGKTIAFWEARTQRDPGGFLEWRELAGAYLARQRETGDIADAVKAEAAARRSLKIFERRNANAWIRLGRSLLAQHRFPEALAAAKSAVALDPAANRLVADVQIELGDYDAAERALNADPARGDDLNYLAIRARLDEIQGRSDAALSRWKEARAIVAARPDMPAETAAWIHTMLGHTLIDSGHLDEGEAACREALAVLPNDYRAMTGLAEAAVWREDWNAAAQWAEKAVAACAQNPEALKLLAEAQAKLGKTKDADATIRRFDDLCGSFPRIYDRHWILFRADQGRDLNKALKLAQADLELRKDVFAYDTLAWVYVKKGMLPEAEKAITQALALGTQSASLFHHAGTITQASGNPDRAKLFFTQARALNPFLMKGVKTE